jgi:HEAT repeat protein
MTRTLANLFNIRPGEWARLSILCLMLFLSNAGFTWGLAIAEATFLKNVGVAFLPWLFIAGAVVFVLVLAIYTPVADRISNDRILIAILLITAALFLLGRALLDLGLPIVGYTLLYLVAQTFLEIFNLHWATYVVGFYDAQTAKRMVPIIVAAARLASILAGLSMATLNRLIGPDNLFVLWALIALAIAALAWAMPRLLREPPQPLALAAQSANSSYLTNIREGWAFVTRSIFLRWMALASLLVTLTLTLLNFQAGRIMLAELGTVEQISNFVGLLNAVANLILLPILLFALSRLINAIGVGNASLIYPIGALATASSLLAAPGLIAAGMVYVSRSSFRATFYLTIDSLLYNAIPLRVRGRARAFISGMVVPVGALFGGLILLLPLGNLPWILPLVASLLAIGYIVCAFLVRHYYSRALVQMLAQEDYSFLLTRQGDEISAADPATLKSLASHLQPTTAPDRVLFLARLLAQIGGSKAVPLLVKAARETTSPQARGHIVAALNASGTRSPQAITLYREALADDDLQVRAAGLLALREIDRHHRLPLLTAASTLIDHSQQELRLQAMPTLLDTDDLAFLAPAMAELNRLRSSANSVERLEATRVLARLGDMRGLRMLVAMLHDPDDGVRLEAARAVESLAQQGLPPWAELLLGDQIAPLMGDSVARVRQAALQIVGSFSTAEAIQILASGLHDPAPGPRATAIAGLVKHQRASVALVEQILYSPTGQRTPASATLIDGAVAVLAQLEPRHHHLVRERVRQALQTIYGYHLAAETLSDLSQDKHSYPPRLALLRQALQEQATQRLDTLFDLLAAVYPGSTARVIRTSFNSALGRVRAGSLEALETLTGREYAQLIAPLLAAEPAPELKTYCTRLGIKPLPVQQLLNELCAPASEPLLRMIAVYALGELLEKGTPPQNGTAVFRVSPPLPGGGGGTQPDLDHDRIAALLAVATVDELPFIREAALVASRDLATWGNGTAVPLEGTTMLALVEKIMLLKEVPFFQGMSIDQLKVLAAVCTEELYAAEQQIYAQGDAGGALYVVVSGRVALEQERRRGSFARLNTIEPLSSFGEMNLFDGSARGTAAIALQDSLVLRLGREPLIALARQYPELSLELINVLSASLRTAHERIAELTRTKPRELHKLYDQFE